MTTEYIYDSDHGWYINTVTGETLVAEELELGHKDTVVSDYNLRDHNFARNTELLKDLVCAKSVTSIDPDNSLLLDLIYLNQYLAKEGMFEIGEVNPDLKIGETLPYNPQDFEELTYKGITQRLMPGLSSLGTPNCVEIDNKTTPILYTEQELPNKESAAFYQSLYMAILAYKENPQASWIKWMPQLVSMLVNHINLQDPSGEISIPDLLSTFAQLRDERGQAWHLVRESEARSKKLAEQLKQLRAKLYGRKHY